MTWLSSVESAWPVFVQGMVLGLGLIVAIGAQNAFVLRQGLRREHVWAALARSSPRPYKAGLRPEPVQPVCLVQRLGLWGALDGPLVCAAARMAGTGRADGCKHVGAVALVGAPRCERVLMLLKLMEIKNLTFISFGNLIQTCSASPTEQHADCLTRVCIGID